MSSVRENKSLTTLFFSLHRVLRHGAFKQVCSKSNICSQTDDVYHCFGHNFCSEMSSLVTNTSKQSYFINVGENQSLTTLFFILHRVLRHGVFKQFCSKSNICSQTGDVYTGATA